MSISRKRIEKFNQLLGDAEWVSQVLSGAARARLEPVEFSALPYWLNLDTWTQSEGLLLLAGIDPRSTVDEQDDESFFVPALWEFKTAQPFSQPPYFTLEPFGKTAREDYPGDDASFESLLERAEEVTAILDGYRETIRVLCHVLDRSVNGLGTPRGRSASRAMLYGPEQFLAWAASIKYQVPWRAWANAKNLIPEEAGPFTAPYFDADADDYPDLLHIAVRAWEHVRKETEGTPKQRVLEYLAARHQSMPQGSRDAIAQVVNWQRAGGRPAKTRGTRG